MPYPHIISLLSYKDGRNQIFCFAAKQLTKTKIVLESFYFSLCVKLVIYVFHTLYVCVVNLVLYSKENPYFITVDFVVLFFHR